MIKRTDADHELSLCGVLQSLVCFSAKKEVDGKVYQFSFQSKIDEEKKNKKKRSLALKQQVRDQME